MLQPLEQIFFRNTDEMEYPGIVLGSEADYFWLLVPALRNVYQGHPDTVANLSDRKVFWAHDRRKAVDSLFDECGQFNSDVFWCSENAKPMENLLATFRLIGAHGL
jgi:hypothetical protein